VVSASTSAHERVRDRLAGLRAWVRGVLIAPTTRAIPAECGYAWKSLPRPRIPVSRKSTVAQASRSARSGLQSASSR
jgi:hypothetical protein